MVRLYADFNNMDEMGRLRLNTFGTKKDLELLGLSLTTGSLFTLYMEDVEVEARVVFDNEWLAVVDMSTLWEVQAP